MKHLSFSRAAAVLAAGALSACFDPALAQAVRSVQPAAQPSAPTNQALPGTAAAGAPAVRPGLPSAAGLRSPSPFPAGLPSPLPFPAGTPSTVIAVPGTAADTGAVIQPGTTAPPVGGAVVQPGDTAGAVVPNTAVMGGPGAATFGSSTAAAPQTAVQVIQSFNQADINRDGGVTRGEAQRLPLPISFEELDVNKDGVLSRGEYEDAF